MSRWNVEVRRGIHHPDQNILAFLVRDQFDRVVANARWPLSPPIIPSNNVPLIAVLRGNLCNRLPCPSKHLGLRRHRHAA
jgi:hypothetical protein